MIFPTFRGSDLHHCHFGRSPLFLIFPLFPHSAFAMATMIQFFIFSLYGMGWNTIGGYGGQVDLGKAQYVGIGAYTTAVLLIRWDIPFWFSMPIGVALLGELVVYHRLSALPSEGRTTSPLRPSPPPWCSRTSSKSGISSAPPAAWRYPPSKYAPPDFLRLIFQEDVYYYYVIFVFFLLGILYMNWFRKSRLGFQLRAIKDNEERGPLARHQRSLGQNQNLCHRHRLCQRGRLLSRLSTSRTSNPKTP